MTHNQEYFRRLELQPNHVRWVTKGPNQRYRAVLDESGALRWELVCRGLDEVIMRSCGAFYANMEPCAPTWRQHHPLALVELVRAVRVHAAQFYPSTWKEPADPRLAEHASMGVWMQPGA
jgi:hypothetical protein